MAADEHLSKQFWYHASKSPEWNPNGWVHAGTKDVAQARAKTTGRPYIHELEFAGEMYGSADEPLPDKVANLVTGNTDWERSEVEENLQQWHAAGGPNPGRYMRAAEGAAKRGAGLLYQNTWDVDTPALSLVAPAKTLRHRGVV